MLTNYASRLSCVFWLTTIQLVLLAGAHGAEQLEQTGQTELANAEKIAELIRRLDADQFSDRNAASRQLQQLGPAACPALADAAVNGSREQRNRALDVLDQLVQEGQPTAREAARRALKDIASSDHEASAGRAREILEPKQEPPAVPVPNLAPAQIQIQMNAIAGGVGGRAVQRMKIQNGVKQIETDDGQRRIKIVEDPNEGIQVEITEEKDGEDRTEKFQVKDGKELAERHPDAHAVYQRMQNAGGIQIQGMPVGVPPIRLQLGGPQQGLELPRQLVNRMLQSSLTTLERSIQQLELSKGEGEKAKQVEASIDRLREIAKQLKEEITQLDGR